LRRVGSAMDEPTRNGRGGAVVGMGRKG
jgi:hypothetical protein